MGAEAVSAAVASVLLDAAPDDQEVNAAVEDFARAVLGTYGPRVMGIYLFGSRARGDHRRESDADVAVVLCEDGEWDYWSEKTRLTDIAYDLLLSTGADIQGWPVRAREWDNPGLHRNPALVNAMQKEGREIGSRA